MIAAVALTGVLVSSCDHPKNNTMPQYRISKEIIYDENGLPTDSSFYSYTANNQIANIKVIGSNLSAYSTFEYSGWQIVKRHVYADQALSNEVSYQTITYNADGSIGKEEEYVKSGANFQKVETITFNYANGKVSSINVIDNTGSTPATIQTSNFTYAGNNVSSISSTDLTANPQETTVFTYGYGTDANHYNKPGQPFLTDPVFNGEVDESDLAMLISANNLSSITVNNVSSTVAYSVDNNQNLLQVKLNNKPAVTYQYQQY